MKYRVIIITLVIALFLLAFSDLTFSSATANHPEVRSNTADHLVINEVYYLNENNTWWIEIYNPTDRQFNLTHLTYYVLDCISILPSPVLFNPHEYVIFCGSIENLTASWDIPTGTKMIELDSFGGNSTIIIASNDTSKTYYDSMGEDESYPYPPLTHSWARYRGGYDTDNFTNDFYDEPYPTPGYENHWEKPKLGIIHSPNSRNVTLHWNYTVNPDIRKYNLLVSSLPSFPQNATNTIEIVDTNISSYEFTNLSDGRYYFKLLVYNSTGSYAESNVVTIPQPPSPPLNLTTTLSDSKVKLTWEPPLSDGNAPITEYKIYRGTSESSLEVMASVNGSVNEYLDDNITKGEKYYYAVSVVNPVGESNLSEVVSIEIPKEKEQVPSIGFAGIIGVIAIAMYIRYRRKREK